MLTTNCFLSSVVILRSNASLTAPARQVIITRKLPQKLVQRTLTVHTPLPSVSCYDPKYKARIGRG